VCLRATVGERRGKNRKGITFETVVELLNDDGKEAKTFDRGETITLVVKIRNTTDSEQTLTLPSSQDHDCTVSEQDGEEIWKWSGGRMFAQALTEMTFAPGEEKRFAQRWNQVCSDGTIAAVGRYVVVGSIPARVPGTVSKPVALSIR